MVSRPVDRRAEEAWQKHSPADGNSSEPQERLERLPCFRLKRLSKPARSYRPQKAGPGPFLVAIQPSRCTRKIPDTFHFEASHWF
jgi:hypothetical protein